MEWPRSQAGVLLYGCRNRRQSFEPCSKHNCYAYIMLRITWRESDSKIRHLLPLNLTCNFIFSLTDTWLSRCWLFFGHRKLRQRKLGLLDPLKPHFNSQMWAEAWIWVVSPSRDRDMLGMSWRVRTEAGTCQFHHVWTKHSLVLLGIEGWGAWLKSEGIKFEVNLYITSRKNSQVFLLSKM